MRSILITGGCGFIGSNFVRAVRTALPSVRLVNFDKLTYAGNLMNLADLDAGSDTDEKLRFVRGDILDASLLDALFAEEDFDTVVHFAAETHVDRSILEPGGFVRTNVLGTQTLTDAARRHWTGGKGKCRDGVRFLQVSTDEVFGSLGETGRFDENTPYDPRSPYSASKAAADHLVRAAHHTYGLPTLITHCSNNYGPYQFPEKLVPLVIRNAREGREIPVYGDGRNVRDWLFVTDHCTAILEVLARGAIGGTYCVGGNCERQNLEVVETICDLVDEFAAPGARPRRDLITFVPDRPGHDRRYAIDTEKISTELGWSPTVDFDEGIRRTVEWYFANDEWVEAIADGSYRKFCGRLSGNCS